MQVTIGGIDIRIVLEEDSELKDAFGEFRQETESIILRKHQPQWMRRKTLVHECFHAYLYISGYTELLESMDTNLEEAMCRSIEQAMGHLFAFDADVEAWLVKK